MRGGGADYQALPTSVTFAAGVGSVTVPVTVFDDTDIEGTETINLSITPNPSVFSLGSSSAMVNIADNDA